MKKKLEVWLQESVYDMVGEMRESMFANSKSEVIRNLIIQAHSRTFGQKKTDKKQVGERICTMLGGEFEGGVCTYTRYSAFGSEVREYSMSVPGDLLTEEMVSSQYEPSEKVVKALLAKAKKK